MENRVYVPKSTRKKILQKYSSAVAHYQPLIEQRISELAEKPANIGEVAVKDMKKLSKGLRDYTYNQIENSFERVLYDLTYPFILSGSVSRRKEAERDFLTYWFNNDIYVSFYHGTEPLEGLLDQNVIHELSHGLWIVLGGESQFDPKTLQNPKKFKRASEGFASFCEFDFFKDFYPNGLSINREVYGSNNYNSEREAVKELVEANGEKFLLDFPKNWRSYIK